MNLGKLQLPRPLLPGKSRNLAQPLAIDRCKIVKPISAKILAKTPGPSRLEHEDKASSKHHTSCAYEPRRGSPGSHENKSLLSSSRTGRLWSHRPWSSRIKRPHISHYMITAALKMDRTSMEKLYIIAWSFVDDRRPSLRPQ